MNRGEVTVCWVPVKREFQGSCGRQTAASRVLASVATPIFRFDTAPGLFGNFGEVNVRAPVHLRLIRWSQVWPLGNSSATRRPEPGIRRSAVSPRRRTARGVTLVEMLVSVALTLLLVLAIVQVFGLLGESVTNSRAMIEMSGQLRAVANRLQADLDGVTVDTLPPVDPAKSQGYFEYVEGPARDNDVNADGTADADPTMALATDATRGYFASTPYGDIDDILAFTTRSDDQPFTGRLSDPRVRFKNPLTGAPLAGLTPRDFESQEAEVIWWVQADRPSIGSIDLLSGFGVDQQIHQAVDLTTIPRYADGQPVRSLHRRVLLVRPDVDLSQIVLDSSNPELSAAIFFNNNDISARIELAADGKLHLVANSLADLTQRENRFAHTRQYPGYFLSATVAGLGRVVDDLKQNPSGATLFGDGHYLLYRGALKNLVIDGLDYMRRGEDVMLSDVLAFDVRAFDPIAPAMLIDGIAVGPGDNGYAASLQASLVASRGAFVDLGYNPTVAGGLASQFSALPHPKSRLTNEPGIAGAATYCTWTTYYERDGVDQPGPTGALDGRVDWATNGLDDDGGRNGVDDINERETMPPYSHSLRGIKVSIRMMEYNTRQIRQISVLGDFLPE